MYSNNDDGHHLRCAHCRYDLFGLPSDVCPECGTAFDPEKYPKPPEPVDYIGGAVISIIAAVASIFSTISVALRSIPNSNYGCRGSLAVHVAPIMILAITLVTMIVAWNMCQPNPICRRISINASLAMITAWITAIVILKIA